MTTTRRFRSVRLTLAAALLVAAPVAVSGCSVIEGVIEEQTGGEIDLGGNEVPADFPAEVPLIDGEVVFGATLGSDTQKIWNVTIKVGDGALETITGQLEGAGFAGEPVTETAQGSAITFTKDDLGVLVLVSADGDNGSIAAYTVTRTSSAG